MARPEFLPLAEYLPSSSYTLLPFQFMRVSNNSVLLTNDLGEYVFLSAGVFDRLVKKQLDTASTDFLNLRAKYFVADPHSSVQVRVMASKYRTKKSFLDGFTKLHIFVVSLRCDHSCPYCQVSRQSEDKRKFDMPREQARRAVDLMLRTPARAITCEFQGGEALLNFDLVKEIVQYVQERNGVIGKTIEFVICTNLSTLTDEHLEFCRRNQVKISTSLDGPAFLHDHNRPFSRGSSHATTIWNLKRAQEALGVSQVSALMTTTKESLKYPKEIVDEYLRLGLGSIVLRSLSPYGFAVKTMKSIGYSSADFLEFYANAFAYILEINCEGRSFPEGLATVFLRKMMTPFATGFVDLQSPAGAGFGVVVYNYDGNVYASDESRMLAEMGDVSFKLGNVNENTYEEIFFGERMRTIAATSCNESLAGCSDCALQPFCGADPVFHYATQGDMYGNRATSEYCKRNMGILRILLGLLQAGDQKTEEIFWAWIHQADVLAMRLPEVSWQSS